MDARLARALGLSGFAIFVIVVTFVTPSAAGKSDVADAAIRGDIAAVRALLAQKADVNAPQADGATALHWAVYRGDKELADMLLRAGANAEGRQPRGLHAAVAGQRQRRRRDDRRAARRPAPIPTRRCRSAHAADDGVAHRQRRRR